MGALGTRIIDTIEKACGAAFRPALIRRGAEAEADKIRTLAEAKADRKMLVAEADLDIAERTRRRIEAREAKRQENLENVTRAALEAAEETNAEPTDHGPVDDDWMARFVNNAQDVSNEAMQKVWGRALVGEARAPGSYSLRSLSCLSNMTHIEALLFQRLCHIAFDIGHVFKLNPGETAFREHGLDYDDLLILRAVGVLHYSDTLSVTLSDESKTLKHNGNLVVFSHESKDVFQFRQVAMTPVGIELKSLVDQSSNLSYLRALADVVQKDGYKMRVTDLAGKVVLETDEIEGPNKPIGS